MVPVMFLAAALIAALASAAPAPAALRGTALHEQTAYFIGSVVVAVFALIMGAWSFTDEFRHGSIVPTLTLTPQRGRVLAAKMLVSAILGALLAAVVLGVIVGVMAALAGVKDAAPSIGGDTRSGMAGLVGAGALWAALGAAVGAAMRSQIAAVVGALVWIVIVENVATGVLGGIAPYLPGRAGYALADAEASAGLVAVAVGAGVLAAYTTIGALVGLLLLRRDVSGA